MVFSSPVFLFFFLPLVCLAVLLVPARLRNALLLIASLVFYAWGAGSFVLVLLASITINFAWGLVIGWAREAGRSGWRRFGVTASVAVNLALLGYYKYANFAVAGLSDLRLNLGLEPPDWIEVALPVGISFFTFQSMSYAFDVARGAAAPLRNPIDYALYIALFPQLVAGPIVRFQEIAEQIRERSIGGDDFATGALRFAHGLVKKVVIADSAGAIADAAFGLPGDALTTAAAWLGMLAYSVQIYFDFSGYSDMAIGIGRIFGFKLPENFRRPYSAISITDFWRRWHITLSTWFRDYVYVPLGGSRGGPLRTYVNLILVFTLTGLWHGANWTFLLWGGYHGALLILERVGGQRPIAHASHITIRRIGVFFLVTLGWVMFRAPSVGEAMSWYGRLVRIDASPLPLEIMRVLSHQNQIVLVFALGVVLLPRNFSAGVAIAEGTGRRVTLARIALVALALPYALAQVVSGSFSPFLYFQF